MSHPPPEDRGLVSRCPKTELFSCLVTILGLTVTCWYLPVAPRRTKRDTWSSLMWGSRAFPHGQLIKIYPASAKSGSGKFVFFLSIRRQSPYRVTVSPKAKVLTFASQTVNCLNRTFLFFSVESLSEAKLRLSHPPREDGGLVTLCPKTEPGTGCDALVFTGCSTAD